MSVLCFIFESANDFKNLVSIWEIIVLVNRIYFSSLIYGNLPQSVILRSALLDFLFPKLIN